MADWTPGSTNSTNWGAGSTNSTNWTGGSSSSSNWEPGDPSAGGLLLEGGDNLLTESGANAALE